MHSIPTHGTQSALQRTVPALRRPSRRSQAGHHGAGQRVQAAGAVGGGSEAGDGAGAVRRVVGEEAAGRAAVAHGGGQGAADVGGGGEGAVVLVAADPREPVAHLGARREPRISSCAVYNKESDNIYIYIYIYIYYGVYVCM
jgi:hypothetical protein